MKPHEVQVGGDLLKFGASVSFLHLMLAHF